MPRDTPSPSDRISAAGPAVLDTVARWRHHWWNPGAPVPEGDDLLSLLTRAEYGRGADRLGTHTLAPDDLRAAELRRAARAGTAHDPLALVTAAGGNPMLRSALAEAWAVTVAAGHRDRASAALRSRLLLPVAAAEAACLLDLAEAHGLRPLTAAECAARARSEDRWERHAALRHLSGLPGGHDVLPTRPATSDPYESLLLSAAWNRADPGASPGADFRRAVRGLPARPAAGLVTAQSMMTGHLSEPGVGLSGGMSVLVAGLGDAMAATRRVSRVLTVVLLDASRLRRGRQLVEQIGSGHWALGIPVPGSDPVDPATALCLRPAISWWAARLLGLPGAAPDVVHARFADDYSLAVADAARRCGFRFVFTATPDPHRTMAERHQGVPGASRSEPAAALRLDLHRIFVADRLVARSDLLVTIPGRSGADDLSAHFPQLRPAPGSRRIASPPEGIPPFTPRPGDARVADALLGRLFQDGGRPDSIDTSARGMRLILSVGRLHPVKQQDRLVEAWLEAELHRSTTMLLIGGSPTAAATPVEQEMRARIAKLLSGHPQARRRIALWPALPNRRVRILERALAAADRAGRTLYVCPSAKEEFGLAILEAMDSGLPAAGPQRGGVPHYIRDGANGFLLPTGSTAALAERLSALADLTDTELARVAAAGRRSVATRFSASAMAESLAAEYHRLIASAPSPGAG
ncbi:glycosyltransferase family 4 protein [Kitasatospora sp. A2-31]|uniref:glycosyltransferase family 4 protein n=1 Tax=Kitasatospora sp. A2-31 TaxID=2916414 RepID=UPI001EEC5C8E|nr:glycosyltransferase [Kitasatospora sp. A2-31]MCG6498400.1 glycosyltransferase [Kitasatospora sp. A2-31]